MVGIAGLGLIGASLGLALRRSGVEVSGFEPEPWARGEALRRGAAGTACADIEALARESEVLFLCAPPPANEDLLGRIARIPALPPRIVSDTSSVKAAIAARARGLAGGSLVFVPGHPMAGSEKSGAAAARADLFEGAPWYLCSDPIPEPLARLVAAVGGRVVTCSPAEHDARMAALSHLPQALGWLVQAAWASRGWNGGQGGPVARELERLAASPIELWADILLENREAVLGEVETLRSSLTGLAEALGSGDRARLIRALRPGRA